ncbi:hypothetical protein C8T65DRAFT_585998 [Cerioporus squamosus]|nr:hypothetical protein C8T65DRAFT_585998 [Cerioporus squamosus]
MDILFYITLLIAKGPLDGGNDLVAFLSANKSLYVLGKDTNASTQLWHEAHLGQFGTVPPELHGCTWCELVVERVHVGESPIVKMAQYIIEHYKLHTLIKYPTAVLLSSLSHSLSIYSSSGPGLCLDVTLYGATAVIRPYMNRCLEVISHEDDYMDAKIHYSHLSSAGQGPQFATHYLGLQHIASLPVPWPYQSAPLVVYCVFPSALNCKSPKLRALSWFHGSLVPMLETLRSLVHATHNSSSVEWPQDTSLPSTYPLVHDILVVNARYIPNMETRFNCLGFTTSTLHNIKWSHMFPALPILLGAKQLYNTLQDTLTARWPRVCLLFSHAGTDHLGSPLAWVPHTSHLNERSTITYAFDADQAYREGFDLTLFRRHHLDYIITMPLRSLWHFDVWRNTEGLDTFTSPGIDAMVQSARIPKDHAIRLHEILVRMAALRGLGAGAYEGKTRHVGDALPYGYVL